MGCTVQDVSVRLAPDSFACFAGGNGAGGTQLNIACHGGRFGVYFKDSEGSPVIAGAILEGQSESSVVWSSQNSLVLVGVVISRDANRSYSGPAVVATSALTAVDSTIDCGQARGGSQSAAGAVAIRSVASVYAKHIFTRRT